MVLVIDGYNLGRLMYDARFYIDTREYNLFITSIARYQEEKTTPLERLIIVFDGGQSTHPEGHRVHGMEIVFSGHQMSADDVIELYAHDKRISDCVVVTNDRELQRRCRDGSAQICSSQDFKKIMVRVLRQEDAHSLPVTTGGAICKYDGVDTDDELDTLMTTGAMTTFNEYESSSSQEKSSGYKKSKKDRARAKLFHRLS